MRLPPFGRQEEVVYLRLPLRLDVGYALFLSVLNRLPQPDLHLAGLHQGVVQLESRTKRTGVTRGTSPILMSLMAERSFAIRLEHRPRRIAFLVDLGQEAAQEMLAGILRFNLSTWGGRHNPIVPLFNKVVPESYYPLLDVADPDVFYVFGELESRELAEIHQLYSPTLVIQHHLREPKDEQTYGVQLREQATVGKYLTNLRDKLPPYFRRSPEPCVLQLETGEERSLSPFFMWIFGKPPSIFSKF